MRSFIYLHIALAAPILLIGCSDEPVMPERQEIVVINDDADGTVDAATLDAILGDDGWTDEESPDAGHDAQEDVASDVSDATDDGSMDDSGTDDSDASDVSTEPEACADIDDDCDGVDDDCDGEIDDDAPVRFFYLDEDGDGWGYGGDGDIAQGKCPPPGYAEQDGDCDIRDPTIHPGAEEICDFKDNDCDGEEDEGLNDAPWYLDEDGDGWGGVLYDANFCGDDVDGVSRQGGDCNDDRNGGAFQNPGLQEVCNDGVDNDCDDLTDSEDAEDC